MELPDEMFQIKARIAANSQTIGKIRNAELVHFRRKATFHELIRGSLSIRIKYPHPFQQETNRSTHQQRHGH